MAQKEKSKFEALKDNLLACYRFCVHDVWNNADSGRAGKILKTFNLSVRNFLNGEVQSRACSLTYRTVLALVPFLAILFAIARGFGFQNLIEGELANYFPAQREALETGLKFVDNALNQASEGIFLGVGIVMLLWTVLSLMNDTENTFNKIWRVKEARPYSRKVTAYTAIVVFVPILLICSAGLEIFMSSVVQENLPVSMSPFLEKLLDYIPLLLAWIMFTLAFWIIPYTRVKFKYALISGMIFGTLFFVLELIFAAGQVYVSKYNAIYGSFAFLPLLLIWIQLSWMLALIGTVMTYSLQNVYGYHYSYLEDVDNISNGYFNKLTIMSLAVIVKRFENQEPAVTKSDLSGKEYNIPYNLVTRIIDRLMDAGLVSQVTLKDGDMGYQPAFAIAGMTVFDAQNRLKTFGSNNFAVEADEKFADGYKRLAEATDTTLVKDLL